MKRTMNSRAKQGRVVDPDDGLPGGYDSEMDGGYNPADFILPGQDHQGHSERVYCRVAPQYARAMNLIFRGKKFPFRTEGDLFRWSLIRGIKVLDRLEPMPGFIGMADAITEILRQEQYQQEFASMFGMMEKVMNQHIASGANKEARKLLATILRQIRSTEGEDHWRAKSEEEVMRRFGHLMEGAGRGRLASLVTNDAE